MPVPTGLQQLQAVAGAAAGIGGLLGLRPEVIEPGHVSFSIEPRADFANPMGTVHGGVLATLLDTVVSCAVHSALTDSPPPTGSSSSMARRPA